jgi:HD-GYP domain-containing protein (c-di-GMP phosphodiesterase class II)
LSNVLRVKSLEEDKRHFREALVLGLNHLLDLKDIETGRHSMRLAGWARRIAVQLGLEEQTLADVEMASLLHDVGKVGVPDRVLRKRGPLRPVDRRAIEKHPEYGWGVLRVFPGLQDVALFVLHHHERIDGRGYPGRLAGDDIPLGSRIVAVVDTFDAMTSSRPYRRALTVREALRRLNAGAGTQFDPTIVRCFASLAEELVIEEAALLEAPGDAGPA